MTGPPDWPDAACRDHDPDLFFAECGNEVLLARFVCEHLCAHTDDCLDGAIERDEKWGVFGGRTAKQRAKILRAREREANG